MDRKQLAEERMAHWREVVQKWRDSGLIKADFCREHDIRPWQLHYWVKRVAELKGEDTGFARVTASGSGVCLRLGSIRLEIEPGFDEVTVRRLLAVMAGSC